MEDKNIIELEVAELEKGLFILKFIDSKDYLLSITLSQNTLDILGLKKNKFINAMLMAALDNINNINKLDSSEEEMH